MFSEGSSGEYETRARTRRTAKTNTRKPISSLSRRLAVGVNARERYSFWRSIVLPDRACEDSCLPHPPQADTDLERAVNVARDPEK